MVSIGGLWPTAAQRDRADDNDFFDDHRQWIVRWFERENPSGGIPGKGDCSRASGGAAFVVGNAEFAFALLQKGGLQRFAQTAFAIAGVIGETSGGDDDFADGIGRRRGESQKKERQE